MRFADAIKTSSRGLKNAKVRTLLTMLGIVIGIASVILLMSIGRSAGDLILNQIRNTGSNLIFIIPGATKGSRFSSPASVQGIVIKTLVSRDAVALRREPSIVKVAPEVRGQARVIFENNDATLTFDGTTGDFFSVRNFAVQRGHAFSNQDVDSFNHVAVLGSAIAKTLFASRDPLGKVIRLKGVTLEVEGVLESKGVGPFGIDQDNLILIPLSVAQKQLLGIDYFNSITVQASDSYTIEFVKSRITSILREDHSVTDPDKDDFTIRTQADALALLGNITSVLTIFLTAIASISLIVGGIGIMNIMLVSVVERTREIGLRKAVGATNRDILQQFLFEAMMLTFIGGLIGIALGVFLTVGIYFAVNAFFDLGWTLELPLQAIGLAVGVSVSTGILFGLYPASQASRKNPIDALRYE